MKFNDCKDVAKMATSNIPIKNCKNYEDFKGGTNSTPLINMQPHTVFIIKSGLYSLILSWLKITI